MARDGGADEMLPAVVGQVVPDKAMRLKHIQMKQAEAKHRIAVAKEMIRDIKEREIAKHEYTILHAEAELKQYIEHEQKIKSAVDTQ